MERLTENNKITKNVSENYICSRNNAITDSGCTNHYICVDTPHNNIQRCSDGIIVQQPDGRTMRATNACNIAVDHLQPAVTRDTFFLGIKNKALLSLGQLCNNGCEIHMTPTNIYIYIYNNTDATLSLKGNRDASTKMWTINSDNQPNQTQTRVQNTRLQANNFYEYNKKKDIFTYLHKAAYSPVKSTLIKAINAGLFTSWPDLTAELVETHLEKSPATTQGHFGQFRKNLGSTSKLKGLPNPTSPPTECTPRVMPPASIDENVRQNVVSMKLVEIKGKVYSNQTGRFPTTSSKGNKYIMAMYNMDSNAILVEPLKKQITSRDSQSVGVSPQLPQRKRL